MCGQQVCVLPYIYILYHAFCFFQLKTADSFVSFCLCADGLTDADNKVCRIR